MVEVRQEDREAAAKWAKMQGRPQQAANMRRGSCDSAPLVQAFARHRIAAENASHQEITALRARIAEDQAQIAALTTYRENLRDEVIELRARIAELEVEVEVANDPSPYCPICGSCGEDGCCSAQRCLYSDDKLMARIAELEAFQQQAIKQVCELAREAGEAKGKLEASELPGIVDGWREKCERLERHIAELEKNRA